MYKNFYIKYVNKTKNLSSFNGGGSTFSKPLIENVELPLIEIVKLNLSNVQKDIIKEIKIDNTYHTQFYYNSDTIIDEINKFIDNIGNNADIKDELSNIIRLIIDNAITHENEESGIIWLRASDYLKNDDKFRWHRDGSYFKLNENKPIYKFVTSLTGESTPVVINKNIIKKFDDITKYKNRIIDCLYDNIYKVDESITPKDIPLEIFTGLDKLFSSYQVKEIGDNYVQAETLEEGVYFLNLSDSTDSKSSNNGTIHSEPEIQKNRLFIAVLPGPKNKCKEWIDKMKK